VLETEYDNYPALSLYESLGFIREKRLYRFYLNGKDAFRLVLTIPPPDDDDEGCLDAGLKLPATAHRRHRTSYPGMTLYDDDDDDEISSR
jgi:peptide alpha-N-acetyltransferase